MNVTTIVTIIAVLVVVVMVGMLTYLYLKNKTLDDIRKDVYQLILKAEHMYYESGTGKQKLKWVVSRARSYLPGWLQVIITENALTALVQKWFDAVKDLLDDGKYNGSEDTEHESEGN